MREVCHSLHKKNIFLHLFSEHEIRFIKVALTCESPAAYLTLNSFAAGVTVSVTVISVQHVLLSQRM